MSEELVQGRGWADKFCQQTRYVEGAVESLLRTLKWAGLDFDEGEPSRSVGEPPSCSADGCYSTGPGKDGGNGPYFQSQRKEIYDAHLQPLIDVSSAFPFRSPPSTNPTSYSPSPPLDTLLISPLIFNLAARPSLPLFLHARSTGRNAQAAAEEGGQLDVRSEMSGTWKGGGEGEAEEGREERSEVQGPSLLLGRSPSLSAELTTPPPFSPLAIVKPRSLPPHSISPHPKA